VKRGTIKDVDEIINGGRDKPTEPQNWVVFKKGLLVPDQKFKL
jgi:hypothetical protein